MMKIVALKLTTTVHQHTSMLSTIPIKELIAEKIYGSALLLATARLKCKRTIKFTWNQKYLLFSTTGK